MLSTDEGARGGLHCPAGVRSDNARMEFTLSSDTATRTLPRSLSRCQNGAEVSD
jgi:hypothetical protein